MDAILKLLPYLGAVGIVAGLVGYYGKARGDTVIEIQGKTIDSQATYISQLEKDLAAERAKSATYRQQSEAYLAAAQGSPQLIKLTAQMKKLADGVTKLVSMKVNDATNERSTNQKAP